MPPRRTSSVTVAVHDLEQAAVAVDRSARERGRPDARLLAQLTEARKRVLELMRAR